MAEQTPKPEEKKGSGDSGLWLLFIVVIVVIAAWITRGGPAMLKNATATSTGSLFTPAPAFLNSTTSTDVNTGY